MFYYKYNIGDFDRETRHLTRIERSIYRDLLDLYYSTETQISLDLNAVCRLLIARSDEERTAVEQVLSEFFVKTPTGWYQSRCEREIAEYRANQSQKAMAGKASAAAKQAKKEQAINVCSTGVEQTNNGVSTKHKPETRNQEPETKKEKSASPSGSRLPTDWTASPEQLAWARADRPDLDPAREAASFRDYWHAKAGKDGRKVDWDATFRNWIRNARGSPGVTKSKTTQFFEEQVGQINEHMAAHGNQNGPLGAGLPQLGTYTAQRGAGVRGSGECLGLGVDAGSGMGRAARYPEASDGIFAHVDGLPGMAEPS